MDDTVSVLFVCLGNICRSPLAEGVFVSLLEEEGIDHRFDVDSAGTGAYHVGESPDPRSVDVARRNGIDLRGQARQVEAADFDTFDYVLAMDRSNLRALEELRPESAHAALNLLREFDPETDGDDLDVPDPYYGGPGGFDRIFEMIDRSCRELLQVIREEGR
ncbi:MAG: low molecular weight protein-tyrosine-phosphatase [Longimicrobiales bacterium]|nr:low molecular weight protein-tyrosine-phosphatase [Longimicrobiales bacterium]